MPKVPPSSSRSPAARRHNPLADDLSTTGAGPRTKPATGKRKSRSEEELNGDGYIDALSSRKIISIAQDLADEDDAEHKAAAKSNAPNDAFTFGSRLAEERFDEEDDAAAEFEDEEEWLPDEDVADDDVDPQDMAIYSRFLSNGGQIDDFAPSIAQLSTSSRRKIPVDETEREEETQTINLADLILQRIAEKEALQTTRASGRPIIQGVSHLEDAVEIPAKVADVFQKCALILSRYKSGPLPKPFKVLPTLPSWPELLALTRPESWTPNATFAATKIFISSQPPVAQHFLTTVLLDHVKDDIHETRKLNVHLYNSLKKSLYKPAAFFKGFLFPLVMEGCTLREAHIVSSVLARVSIPALHSAAALLRLCEIAADQSSVSSESAGATNIFIRVLLEKKYALPYKAVDALVFHFLRYRASKDLLDEQENHGMHGTAGGSISRAKGVGGGLSAKETKLPVLWHQCLLMFAQRYKNDITEDQREALLDLLLARGHKDIGPEVRRELLAGRGRGVVAVEPSDLGQGIGILGDRGGADDGDDTMVDVGI